MKDSRVFALAGVLGSALGCLTVVSLIVAVLALNLGVIFGLALLVHLAIPEISLSQALAACVGGMTIGLLISAFRHR